MRLKNRFKNRCIYRPTIYDKVKYRVDFTARDFRASIICTLARFESKRVAETAFINMFSDVNKILNDLYTTK